jgi:hypothetical protein
VVLAGLVVMGAGSALAQEPRPGDETRRRQQTQVVIFEGVLAQAVNNGASALVRQFRGSSQLAQMTELILSGKPHVRGFRLDGYGMFFDVRVPGIRPAFALAFPRYVAAQRQRDQANEAQAVRAQSLPVEPAPPPPVAPVDAVPNDPGSEYTNQVKAELLEAILENSHALRITANEVLTVAARDDAPVDPLVPADQADVQTVYFTVKGSDLAAYHEKRVTREEAQKLVAVRED